MKLLTHTEGTWYCLYDVATKRVLVPARACSVGAKLTYDNSKVEVLTASSEEALLALISNL